MSESTSNGMIWSFFQAWNGSLGKRKDRILTPRQHIWASELGGSYIDRYLKMTAVEPTNPPNMRSLRKFDAGNMWEGIAWFVLSRAGVLINSQEWLEYQLPDMLSVTGKLDFLAGGKPDWQKARSSVKEMSVNFGPFGEFISRQSLAIIDYLSATYGNELKTLVLECKSVSSFMFDRYERTGKANPHHEAQLMHYLLSKNLPEGHIIYICKDDCRMLEFPVFNTPDGNSPTMQMYKSDVEKMTHFIKNKIEPNKEELIIFSEDLGKFSSNWKVEYSGYLTKLYGFSEPEAYRALVDPKISSFNRGFSRLILSETGGTTPTGKPIKLTDGNLSAVEEMKATFKDFDSYVKKAIELKKEGLLETEVSE